MAITTTAYTQEPAVPIIKVIHQTATVDGSGDLTLLAQPAIVLAAFTTATTATTAFKIGSTAVSTPDVGGVVALTGNAQDLLVLPQPVSSSNALKLTFDGAGTADYTIVYIDQVAHTAGVGV